MTWVLLLIVTLVTLFLMNTWDLEITKYARSYRHTPFVQFIKIVGENIDDYLNIFFVLLGFIFLLKKKQVLVVESFFIPLSSLTAGIITNILKLFFGRWRPRAFFDDGQYGFTFFAPVKYVLASYPSGHSSSIMAIMTALAILLPRYRLFFFTAAVIIASFRIIIGAHYLSDVIAGLALGYLSAHWLRYWLLCYNQMSEISVASTKMSV